MLSANRILLKITLILCKVLIKYRTKCHDKSVFLRPVLEYKFDLPGNPHGDRSNIQLWTSSGTEVRVLEGVVDFDTPSPSPTWHRRWGSHAEDLCYVGPEEYGGWWSRGFLLLGCSWIRVAEGGLQMLRRGRGEVGWEPDPTPHLFGPNWCHQNLFTSYERKLMKSHLHSLIYLFI